jgi:hypothetical protein|tara:strand:+ start:633 stop:851 length:219 start_codon:yes stop_codon:yes gene_type:complete
MGMGITIQTLDRIKQSDPDKHDLLHKLWQNSFGEGATIGFVEAQCDAAGLNNTGNEDIDFVISAIKLNISNQ